MVQMIGGDSPFANTADFVSALLRTAVEEPDIRPAELVELLDTLSVLG
jgi:hypothetical protein